MLYSASWVGGVDYTIKDGIVYDARALLDDVAEMVEEQKEEWGIESLWELHPEAPLAPGGGR